MGLLKGQRMTKPTFLLHCLESYYCLAAVPNAFVTYCGQNERYVLKLRSFPTGIYEREDNSM